MPLWITAPVGPPLLYAALALTPVAVLGALLVGVVALGTRRWVVGGAAVLAALVLAAFLVPRALPDGARGRDAGLVVATSNLQYGRGDPAQVVALVREQHVAVLGLEELTPEAQARLDAAGLGAELPFRVSLAQPGVAGTALVSRYPLAPSGLVLGPSVLGQVTARVSAPGGPVDVVVTHPAAPIFRADRQGWEREITRLPGPAAPTGVPRVVMGDFNATLDHRPLRALLEGGQRDAAEALGDGLVGTWPTDRALPPFAAIDHVLVSGPLAPAAVSTHRIAGSDHAALVAVLAPGRPADPAPAASPPSALGPLRR